MEPLSRGRMMVALSQKSNKISTRTTTTKKRHLSSSKPNQNPLKVSRFEEPGDSRNTSAIISDIIDQNSQALDTSIDSLFLDPDISFTELADKLQQPTSHNSEEKKLSSSQKQEHTHDLINDQQLPDNLYLPPPPQWMLEMTDVESSQDMLPSPPISPTASGATVPASEDFPQPLLLPCELPSSSTTMTTITVEDRLSTTLTETPIKSIYRHKDGSSGRLKGIQYIGRMKNKESGMVVSTTKPGRQMGDRCECKASWRNCKDVVEIDRIKAFEEFWALNSWEAKKLFVRNLVNVTKHNEETKSVFKYFLHGSEGKMEVCKEMFLNTLAIRKSSVRNWCLQESVITPEKTRNAWCDRGKEQLKLCEQFLQRLNKIPSHYCRKSTGKEYLERHFKSIQDVFLAYTNFCATESVKPLSRQAFSRMFSKSNIGIFMPRKDQCDICVAFEKGNLAEDEWKLHREMKQEAQDSKAEDKVRAEKDNSLMVISMDLQAVLLSPASNASALYYKTKLRVHNFTIFELTNKRADCFVWHESEGGVTSSEFASCIYNYLKTHAIDKKCIVIYSDGCCYQNRNVLLSKTLCHFAMEERVAVEQKYLEKGHTQMECDSIHAVIERKLRGEDIHSPSDYVRIIKSARKNGPPYNVHYLDHTYFTDFSKVSPMTSIRPGRMVGDAKVTNLRCLRYEPDGNIFYKLRHTDDWRELPRQRNEKIVSHGRTDRLYQRPIKISKQKYQDLQEMKVVLPKDVHGFYDNLPHQ